MKVLIACEFSGVVRDAFTKRGHDAMSCDLLPSDTEGKHYQGNILDIIDNGWDLMIAHPPCTWLCQAMRTNAARKDRPHITNIYEEERNKAFHLILRLWESNIEKVAIENPIGFLNGNWMKPTQIVRPWMFGHEYKKDICLWLRGLPKLTPTNIVDPPYKKLDYWSNKRNPNGRSLKSITFRGVAEAMAEQWG